MPHTDILERAGLSKSELSGGSLVVIDRAGQVAWYKMDPTYRDENLLAGLVERLLAAPAPSEGADAGTGGEGGKTTGGSAKAAGGTEGR